MVFEIEESKKRNYDDILREEPEANSLFFDIDGDEKLGSVIELVDSVLTDQSLFEDHLL